MRIRPMILRLLILQATVCLGLCGCEPESLEFTEVKRLHERVTSSEFAKFARIVDQLPERRVPPFPPAFLPPPQWDLGRSLPIRELYEEEMQRREECWDTERLAKVFERHKGLMRELRKEQLTPEQFAGLVLTLGISHCRNDRALDDVDLVNLSERAQPFLDALRSDITPFVTAARDREVYFATVQKSMWISRKFRADKLRGVPVENQILAKKHAEWLSRVLPDEFLENPEDEIHDLLEERGMPFEELPESGYDEDIHWQQSTPVPPRNGPTNPISPQHDPPRHSVAEEPLGPKF